MHRYLTKGKTVIEYFLFSTFAFLSGYGFAYAWCESKGQLVFALVIIAFTLIYIGTAPHEYEGEATALSLLGFVAGAFLAFSFRRAKLPIISGRQAAFLVACFVFCFTYILPESI